MAEHIWVLFWNLHPEDTGFNGWPAHQEPNMAICLVWGVLVGQMVEQDHTSSERQLQTVKTSNLIFVNRHEKSHVTK